MRVSSLSFEKALEDCVGAQITSDIQTLLQDKDSVVQDIILDVGKPPLVVFQSKDYYSFPTGDTLSHDRLQSVWEAAVHDSIRSDTLAARTKRSGIGSHRPFDRLSRLDTASGAIRGLTWRVANHDIVPPPVEIQHALSDSTQNMLLYGPPGTGKTSMLRRCARFASDVLRERVMIVDHSGEIGGFSNAHVSADLGYLTRCLVAGASQSHHDAIMEAVRNHTPDTILVDEIMSYSDADALCLAAMRGVRILGTIHADSLDNVVHNSAVHALMGRVRDATVTDARAMKSKNRKKTLRERTTRCVFANAYGVHTRHLDTDMDAVIDGILAQ